MKLTKHGLVAFFLLFTLWGCSKNSAPETRYYVLQATPAEAPMASGEGLELGVETFRVDAPYDREEVVYRVGREALEVGFYAYHRWASPVGQLVAQAVAEAAGGSRENQIDAARDCFYRGFVAEAVDKFYRTEVLDTTGERQKGLLTGDDMARYRAPVVGERPAAHRPRAPPLS